MNFCRALHELFVSLCQCMKVDLMLCAKDNFILNYSVERFHHYIKFGDDDDDGEYDKQTSIASFPKNNIRAVLIYFRFSSLSIRFFF